MALPIEDDKFADTPEGWASRWSVEMDAAKDDTKKWHTRGAKVVKRYLDERDSDKNGKRRLNLFHADTETKRAMLYGQLPKASVGRKYGDPDDDEARVASEMLERLLNCDIERNSDTFATALRNALKDWLLPGAGFLRQRYVAEFETVPAQEAMLHPVTGQELAPAVPETQRKTTEDVNHDYVHWKDARWSPCRTWDELRWIAFRAHMARTELVKRFGEEVGKQVPLNTKKTGRGDDVQKSDPWSRADVWEIWSKEGKEVFWWVEGYGKILDRKPDTLGLDNFWPCPYPLLANLTTDRLMPTPDFSIAQDQYDGIDNLYDRICLLEDAVAVRGAYNKASGDLTALLDTSGQNELIPVDNWALFAEKGGIKGQVDWFPLDMVAAALDKLTQKLSDKIVLLQQVSGVADLMRGASQVSETATAQKIKANFGSIRSRDMQDEFARFASDAQRIKAEIIAKHFDPETILKRSNMERSADAELAQQAVQLIKSDFSAYRIEVKPEAVNMADMASLKQERTEFMQGVSTFFQAMVPLVQAMPGTTPMMLQMIRWAMVGFKGSSTIEGVLDRAIAQSEQQAQQPKPPPPPDPKIVAAQMKSQADMQKTQMTGQLNQQKAQLDMQAEMARTQATLQADLTRIDAETQAEVSKQAAQATFNIQEEHAKHKSAAMFRPEPGGDA